MAIRKPIDKKECVCKSKSKKNIPETIQKSNKPEGLKTLPLLNNSSCSCE